MVNRELKQVLKEGAIKQYSSEYLKLILERNRGGALGLVNELADSGMYSLLEIFDILSMAQQRVGSMWERGSITVVDEHFATETTLDAIEIASERIKKRFFRTKIGTALLANFVEGEFHVIGLKMFAELLRADGWEVEYYSSSLSVAQIFKHLERTRKSFDLICVSLTMSFNLKELQSILKVLRTNVLTKSSKIIVGSQLFRKKRFRDEMIDKETGLPLADLLTCSFARGLAFIRSTFPSKG